MSQLVLVPMTDQEYEAWRGESVRSFAEERMRAGNALPEEALASAQSAFDRLLPHGLATPNHWLYTIQVDGEAVGMVWLGRGQPGAGLPPSTGFIYDLLIYPEHRRKGYATRAMLALEEEARRRGMDRLALHVFGHNEAARRLYEKVGYEMTNITMQKSLEPR